MTGDEIRVGTRGSALALAQARLVVDALERTGQRTRLVVIQTEGDRRAPDTAWGEGAFVTAIADALCNGRIDVAVHSAKDIPTEEDPRLQIAALLERADPRDGLLAPEGAPAELDSLPTSSRVGTDSPRRTGFLLARRPDLRVHPLHGNVDTRLRRLDAGETDALVLACAGLDRLDLGARIAQRIDPELLPPAPGQGAIAIQVRADDSRMVAVAQAIDHPPTRLAVEAERAFLIASGGGCRAPTGALATIHGDDLNLLGGHARPDGSQALVGRRRGPASAGADLAGELAAELESRGRRAQTRAVVSPEMEARRRVLVTRAAAQAHELVAALRAAGVEPVLVPTIAVELEPAGGDLDAAARELDRYAWVVISSANGARAILEAAERVSPPLEAPRWAALGPATRGALEREGIEVDHQPSQANTITLAAELPVAPDERVLILRGDLADEELARALRARGAVVDDVIAYRTREAPESSRSPLRQAWAERVIDAVVFTSGSTVRGLVALARAEGLDVRSVPAVCIGPETAADADRAGFSVLAVSPIPETAALAEATARALATHEQEIR